MRKAIWITAAVLSAAAVFSGCGKKDTGMVDSAAAVVESDFNLAGSWICPGRDFSIEFSEDGTVQEKEKLSTTEGTWQFMSQNESFTIRDRFEEVHYISCLTDKEKVFYSGAVLGDLISGYNETQKMERCYIRSNREPVTEEQLIGSWKDANGSSYYAVLKEDGSLKTTDWEGTYEVGSSEEYGTTLTFHFDEYDEEYAALRYEKYLFLYRVGTSNVYQLQPEEE